MSMLLELSSCSANDRTGDRFQASGFGDALQDDGQAKIYQQLFMQQVQGVSCLGIIKRSL